MTGKMSSYFMFIPLSVWINTLGNNVFLFILISVYKLTYQNIVFFPQLQLRGKKLESREGRSWHQDDSQEQLH